LVNPQSAIGNPQSAIEMAEFKIRAHITGNLWKIVVAEGQAVSEEDTLVIMESMKMEMPIESPVKGLVRKIFASEGASVREGDVIMILEVG
jgi:acetyl-CoA carboxylase biotin carboxyl carrier protein